MAAESDPTVTVHGARKIGRYALLGFLAVLVLFPIYATLMQALKSGPDAIDPGLSGYGFGLTVAVRRNAGGSAFMGAPGAFGWSGVFGTFFWVDPVEDMSVVFMTSLLPSSTHPIRSQLKTLVHQALL